MPSKKEARKAERAKAKAAGRARKQDLLDKGKSKRRAKKGAKKAKQRTRQRARSQRPADPGLFGDLEGGPAIADPGLFGDLEGGPAIIPGRPRPPGSGRLIDDPAGFDEATRGGRDFDGSIDRATGPVGPIDPSRAAQNPLDFIFSRKLRAALQNLGGTFDQQGHKGANAARLRSLIGGLVQGNLGAAGGIFGKIQGGALPESRLNLASPKLRQLMAQFGGQLSADDQAFIQSILGVSPRGDETGPLFQRRGGQQMRTGGRQLQRNGGPGFQLFPPTRTPPPGSVTDVPIAQPIPPGGGGGNDDGGLELALPEMVPQPGSGGPGPSVKPAGPTIRASRNSNATGDFILRGNRQFGQFGSSAPSYQELLRQSFNNQAGGNLLGQF